MASPCAEEGGNRCRSFGVSDGMILIAAAALSLAISPIFHRPIENLGVFLPRLYAAAVSHASNLFEHWPVFWAAVRFPLFQCLWLFCRLIETCLLGMTAPFLVLRLRQPRPVVREVVLQPGTMAVLAILFGRIWVAGYLDAFTDFFKSHMDLTHPLAAGGTVASAWCALALCGLWRAEPGWVDRLGRSLGYGAISVAVACLLIERL